MLTMGIDPSLNHTGIVVVRGTEIMHYETIRPGQVVPYRNRTRILPYYGLERLDFIYRRVVNLLGSYDLESVGMESFSFGSIGRSVYQMGEVSGLIKLAVFKRGIPLGNYAPSQAKVFMTGKGNAKKPDMIVAARDLSGIKDLAEDEADAYALGMIQWNLDRMRLGEAVSLNERQQQTLAFIRGKDWI